MTDIVLPPLPRWSDITGQATRVAEAKHGTFTYYSDDRFLGASLRIYGEYSEGEVDFYDAAIKPTDTAIEVGANIGALTVPLARRCERVLAFEPQHENFFLLSKNLSDNHVDNVTLFPVALGSEPRKDFMPTIKEIDKTDQWGNIGNYGVAEIGHGSMEVNITTLDDLFEPETEINFIKLDCEGSELEVLKGGTKLIQKQLPLIYCENDRPSKSDALINWFWVNGYQCFWHKPYLFNPNNYRGYIHNLFGESKSTNMICIQSNHRDGLGPWLMDRVR